VVKGGAVLLLLFCRSEPARDGGLTADQSLAGRLDSCGRWLVSDGVLTGNRILFGGLISTVCVSSTVGILLLIVLYMER
jgi:hypothetical protein